MRRPSLLAGVTMAAILGLSLATVFMPAIAGRRSGPCGAAPRTPGTTAAAAGGPMLGPVLPRLRTSSAWCGGPPIAGNEQ